jgi:uncharacterized protein (DUF58 family)|tara:strand:- start:403 stop:624 length:222 start_codon:yes stop_codon:yes gene_type:complete
MKYNVAPLSSSFMLTAILGFLISVIWVYPQSNPYGVAFALVFALMFIASIISTTYGDPNLELKLDAPKIKKKK